MNSGIINGYTLINWGVTQDKNFGKKLKYANYLFNNHIILDEIKDLVLGYVTGLDEIIITMDLHEDDVAPSVAKYECYVNDNDKNVNNTKAIETMRIAMKTPTVLGGVLMPDMCPAGAMGNIPVGGVIKTHNSIHPGMHSADICCSLRMSTFTNAEPKEIMDIMWNVTHFGSGGRKLKDQFCIYDSILKDALANPFLNNPKCIDIMHSHLGTQGDGNHFAFVGTSEKFGTTRLVTHHGSRGPGAMLYRAGMKVAEKYRKKFSPNTLKCNAWIPFDTDDGKYYWDALQIIRRWTMQNHNELHNKVMSYIHSGYMDYYNSYVFNEHNFVFKDKHNNFYHAKGATPVGNNFISGSNKSKIIPLSMGQPILIVQESNDSPNDAYGFAPHGAGRNMSRREYDNTPLSQAQVKLDAKLETLDIRSWSGELDTSEKPSAYKDPRLIEQSIVNNNLAEITDRILPYGSIMAGKFIKKDR